MFEELAQAAQSPKKSEAAVASAKVDTKSGKEKSEIKTFGDLDLHEKVLNAVQESGYQSPTAIQSKIIPHMLEGRDVLAQSQTGSGKTAAFALPILTCIDATARCPQVLVLTPTRELAIQVAASFETYGAGLGKISTLAIYGGQDYEVQFRQLRRGPQVVVGTPGRIIDHIKRGTLDLTNISCVVLDEADEMLKMGFLDDVRFVLDQTPSERQTALFSATLPDSIREIARNYLQDPVHIKIKQQTMTAESIRQRAVFMTPRDKMDVLKRFLESEDTDGVIVFTKTREGTLSVAEQLNGSGFSAIALNGDMPQNVRERAIEQLKARRLNVLVATDVAARGLDVERISHVINFDLPYDSESYVHRIGRTGRAGRNGEAIIFLTPFQKGQLRRIERATKQPIEIVAAPKADAINTQRIKRFKQQVSEVVGNQDLTLFRDLIEQHAEASGESLHDIAAALAHIAQQGRPFLVKDRPPRKEFNRDERQQRRGKYDRSERGGYGRRDERGGQNRGDFRQLGPPKPGMNRYRIEVGRNDGVRPGNIVGAVANEAGIPGAQIGPIRIHDTFSTVDLPAGIAANTVQKLQRTRVAGKPMQLSQDRQSGGGYKSARRPAHATSGKSFDSDRKPRSAYSKPARAGGKSTVERRAKPKRRGFQASKVRKPRPKS